jgi:predicted Fe-Mo cluster-binding NifX family protein
MNYRLAIAIEENGDAEYVAEHFGRCTKFNVCELDENKSFVKKEAYMNPLAGQHTGACQLPGYVAQFNVSTIIAGGMGQKAVEKFLQAGINVITAPGLVFSEAIRQFAEGKLSGYSACMHEHEEGHEC